MKFSFALFASVSGLAICAAAPIQPGVAPVTVNKAITELDGKTGDSESGRAVEHLAEEGSTLVPRSFSCTHWFRLNYVYMTRKCRDERAAAHAVADGYKAEHGDEQW